MLALTNDGNRADVWLQDGQILRPDGHASQQPRLDLDLDRLPGLPAGHHHPGG
jgi:hypothetical protein